MAQTQTPSAVWSRRVLLVFGPILILTGILGFVIPPSMALMSGAPPYNVFHIIFGTIGTAIALRGSGAAVGAFNVGFGAVDLWQAVAGVTGLPPAEVFALRPADHVLHVVIGLGLVFVGAAGLRAAPAR